MGESVNKIRIVTDELKNCELSRLDDINNIKMYLFILGNAILISGFLFIAVYLFIIDKQLNLIWELLRTRIQNAFFEIRENIQERISQVHGNNEILNNDFDSNIVKNNQKFKFRHSLRTISKISVIFAIALAFTFIQYFIFEQNLQIPLKYHTVLLSSVMERKILLTRLGFFVLENDISGSNNSVLSVFPFYTGFGNLDETVKDLYTQITLNLQEAESPLINALMSSALNDYIYKSFPSNLTFLSTGTLNGVTYILQEAFYFAFNDAEDSFANFNQYFTEVIALYEALDITSAMNNANISDLISTQLNNLYYFTGGFGILFLLLYFCYYYPMLSSDAKFLEKLTDLLLILPKIQNTVNDKPLTQKKIHFIN